MIRLFLIASAGLFLCACGGSDAADEPVREVPITAETAADMSMPDMADKLIADTDTLTALLTRVDSAETAEEIRPDIEAMAADYTVLFERFEAMGEPSFSDMAALASRAPKLITSQQAIAAQVERIYREHPEAADVLRDALENVGRTTP